jgi:hypothetical protein
MEAMGGVFGGAGANRRTPRQQAMNAEAARKSAEDAASRERIKSATLERIAFLQAKKAAKAASAIEEDELSRMMGGMGIGPPAGGAGADGMEQDGGYRRSAHRRSAHRKSHRKPRRSAHRKSHRKSHH